METRSERYDRLSQSFYAIDRMIMHANQAVWSDRDFKELNISRDKDVYRDAIAMNLVMIGKFCSNSNLHPRTKKEYPLKIWNELEGFERMIMFCYTRYDYKQIWYTLDYDLAEYIEMLEEVRDIIRRQL